MLAAKWTTVLTFADPLLNALSVKDVLFVTVKRRHEVIAEEIAPADRALAPQPTGTFVQILALFAELSLLVLELGRVER